MSARHIDDRPVGARAAEPAPAPKPPDLTRPLSERVDDFRRAAITRAVSEAAGNWAEAARALGMHRSNLHHLAKRLGLR